MYIEEKIYSPELTETNFILNILKFGHSRHSFINIFLKITDNCNMAEVSINMLT